MLELLKEGSIVTPKILFRYYRKLNITEEELIILIMMINLGSRFIYNPMYFSEQLNLDKYKTMNIINSLIEKKIIEVEISKNDKGIMEEYLKLDTLYNHLIALVLDKKEEISETNTSIYETFEKEFGRTLSPMEYEIIGGWLKAPFTEEIILCALKEATYNGVSNLRYIDKIIYEWKKKGINNLHDIEKERENHRKKKQTVPEDFDYNWLEDE